LSLLLALSSLGTAAAADVTFEGYYRARLRAFDTLSLDRENANSEGFALYAQHRLWIRPSFLVSDAVALRADIRGLDGVAWGVEPGPTDALFGAYDLQPPTSETDAQAPLLDVSLWRAWAEVFTDYGQITFGRVPLHWGSGIWLNDGVSVDREFADYGDTTDRAMWELLVQEQFYIRAAIDVPAERFVGFEDDTTGYDLAVSYRVEDLTAGVDLHLDHTGIREANVGALNVFTADAAAAATLGKLAVEAEFVGQFGGGDLEEGLNDASITAFGAVLHADLELDAWKVAVDAGIATGDGQQDLSIRTFAFDRDYSIGMFLFEQPMPTLAQSAAAANETNGGRDFTEVETLERELGFSSDAVSNAIFVKPRLYRRIVEGLWAEASWVGARMAKAPQINEINQSRGYGNEFGLCLHWNGLQHVDFGGRVGLFLPGSVYTVDPVDGQTATTFTEPAFGGQISGRVEF
jgi:hypothetical protein